MLAKDILSVRMKLPFVFAASVYILKEANRLFTQADTHLQSTFLNDILEVFHAGVGYVEFSNNQQTVETINSWVCCKLIMQECCINIV